MNMGTPGVGSLVRASALVLLSCALSACGSENSGNSTDSMLNSTVAPRPDLTQAVHATLIDSQEDFFFFRAVAANGIAFTGELAPSGDDLVTVGQQVAHGGEVDISFTPPASWLDASGETLDASRAADVVSGAVTLERTFCGARALIATSVTVDVLGVRQIRAGIGLHATPPTSTDIHPTATTSESNTKYCPWSPSACATTHDICYGPFSLGRCYQDSLGITCWCSAAGY